MTEDDGRFQGLTAGVTSHSTSHNCSGAALLAALHQAPGFAYYWRPGQGSNWFRAGEVQAPPALEDVYFGVNQTARAGRRGDRAKSSTVAALGCLYSEFDAKDFPGGKAEALGHVEALEPPPSAVVDSGGGYHCYWLLAEPWYLASDEERERARRLQAAWVDLVGGDKGAKDLARVLRVPGTLNTKYSPPRPVLLISLNEGARYTVAELEALAPPPPAPEPVAAPELPRAPLRATRPAQAGRASASEVIARFNAEHSAEELLSHYGATRTSDGYACNCGVPHEHETQIAITSQGNAVFYSARCRWAPSRTDRNGRPIADAFALFAQVEHSGDKTAALKAYNPIQPKPAEQPAEAARPAVDPATLEARRKDAERKRTARRAEAEAAHQAVRDRACEDAELIAYPMAAAVLRELLTLAGLKTWCRPSVAGLAARLDRSERTVQRALAWLEGRYIATEQQVCPDGRVQPLGSRPGRPHSTAVRTFLPEPLLSIETPQSVETGVTPPAVENTPVSPDHVSELVLEHALELVSGAPATLPPVLPEPVELAPLEPEPVAHEGGAAFDPCAPTPAPRDLRGLSSWALLCEIWEGRQPAEQPAELEEEPEVKGPPRDPKRAQRYWALLGKANKPTTGAKQRRALRLQAAALEEWYPASEAPGLGRGEPSPSSRPRVVAGAPTTTSPAPAETPAEGHTAPVPTILPLFTQGDARGEARAAEGVPGSWLPDDYDRAGLLERLRALREPASAEGVGYAA